MLNPSGELRKALPKRSSDSRSASSVHLRSARSTTNPTHRTGVASTNTAPIKTGTRVPSLRMYSFSYAVELPDESNSCNWRSLSP